MFGAKALAREAIHRADQAMEVATAHIKECVEAQRKAAEWRGKVQQTLDSQNKDLDDIKSTLEDSNKSLRSILITAVGSLLAAIAYVIWNDVLLPLIHAQPH